jgi:hypothetical protein
MSSVTRLFLAALAFGWLVNGQDAPKKVSKAEGLSNATTKVSPEYPPVARQLKLEGAVEPEAMVSESGTVEKVNIVSGNPVFTRPAADVAQEMEIPSVHGGRQGCQSACAGESDLQVVRGRRPDGGERGERMSLSRKLLCSLGAMLALILSFERRRHVGPERFERGRGTYRKCDGARTASGGRRRGPPPRN